MQQCPQLLFQLEAVFYCDKTLSTASDKIGTLELELNYHMKKRDCIVSRRDTMGCMDSNSGSEMILQNSVFPHFLVLLEDPCGGPCIPRLYLLPDGNLVENKSMPLLQMFQENNPIGFRWLTMNQSFQPGVNMML